MIYNKKQQEIARKIDPDATMSDWRNWRWQIKHLANTPDTIIRVGKGTLVQHGKHNDRVYLLKLIDEDVGIISGELLRLAHERDYSKICCKIPRQAALLFYADGYLFEGYIPGFYQGKEDAFFVSKFLNIKRLNKIPSAQLRELHPYLSTPVAEQSAIRKAKGYSFRRLRAADVEDMVKIYSVVFKSYPFPIHDSGYLLKTMEENIQYFGAFKEECLVAIASSEIDMDEKNAEMTDFATHPSHTGHRLAYWLLKLMEKEMKQLGIVTSYTIARLNSIPMNKTFLQRGYKFSGTLINNTHIAGEIETMILYYKSLIFSEEKESHLDR